MSVKAWALSFFVAFPVLGSVAYILYKLLIFLLTNFMGM